MSEYIIKVAFRKEDDGRILAVFPEELHDKERRNVTCYAHNGQHGPCALDYAKGLEIPTVDETVPLRNELRAIGYILIDTTL